jgi:DNA-directed RNA polymerase specialized sigma24 family protein
MRWYLDNRTDLWEAQGEEFRDDALRDMVDELLTEEQTHLVSRVFFGGDYLATAAEEIGMSVVEARQEMAEAMEVLREALSQED